MKLNTTRFGSIDVAETDLLHFRDGLLGFPQYRTYALIPDTHGAPFQWLQATENPNLAFVVLDPQPFFPHYHFSVKRSEVTALEVKSAAELQVYVIVTMAAEMTEVTVNLQGPLLVHAKKNQAQQIVLNRADLSTREPLLDQLQASKQPGRKTHHRPTPVALAG